MSRGPYSDGHCTGGPPLVLGGALARRTFYLDEDGVLRGVTYRYPWTPGENVARCLVANMRDHHAFREFCNDMVGRARYLYDTGGIGWAGGKDPVPLPGYTLEPCEGLDPECSCGFYAYHDGAILYATGGEGLRVEGIIEGYGRVVLGSLGYRAQKARIVAITLPAGDTYEEAHAVRVGLRCSIQETEDEMRDLLRARTIPMIGLTALTALIFGATLTPAGLVAAGAFATLAGITQRHWNTVRNERYRRLSDHRDDLEMRLAKAPIDFSERIEKVVSRYPDVEFYRDRNVMLKRHPIESLKPLLADENVERGTE